MYKHDQSLTGKFPTHQSREFFDAQQGILYAEQGKAAPLERRFSDVSFGMIACEARKSEQGRSVFGGVRYAIERHVADAAMKRPLGRAAISNLLHMLPSRPAPQQNLAPISFWPETIVRLRFDQRAASAFQERFMPFCDAD